MLNIFMFEIAYFFLAFIMATITLFSGLVINFWMDKMISKLAKAHESWVFKLISAAVAVSFISLFGVTGYISSASQNQTVVDVDGLKTTQSEFSYRLQKEMNALKNLTDEDFELTDDMRNTLTEGVLRQIIDESVLDQTMKQNDISFPRAYIQQIIFGQPEFANPLNGQFSPDLFKHYLSSAGISEGEYVDMVKRLMARKMIITDMISPFKVPSVLSNAIHAMDNQRRSFKYVLVSPADVSIERQISDDEVQQYFEDFAETFMIPETRSAEVLFLSNEDVLKKYAASDEMVRDYYKENEKEFDQPEKREVLQMVFMDKSAAEDALKKLEAGGDFAKIATESHAENADNPTLGIVTQDELADDLAYDTFEMPLNQPKLLQVADTWQIVSVKQIIPAKKSTFEEAKDQIMAILSDENLYDALREARADIDDAVNGGKDLAEVAKETGAEIVEVSGISENSPVSQLPEALKSLGTSLDFNEMVFSYGLDEISSAEEFDNGIAVVKVTGITDAHLPEIKDVRDKIIALWTIQEKDALAKETADNIVADAENSTQLADAAKARNLELFRSEPISRNETFAGLTPQEISDLFLAKDDEIKVYEHPGNSFIIVTPFETVNYSDELSGEALEEVIDRAEASMAADMAQEAMDSLAEGMEIKVDYKRAGFSE